MIDTKYSTTGYRALFEEAQTRWDSAPRWLQGIRHAGMARFEELGFPTLRAEEWRFTSVAPIAETRFTPGAYDPAGITVEEIERKTCAGAGARLVVVNGHYSRELSTTDLLPDEVCVNSLAAALESDPAIEQHLAHYAKPDCHPFAALNMAFLEDGAFVHVPKGVVAALPIHLVYVSHAGSQPTVSHPRTLVVAEENSQVTVVESYLGSGAYFTNAVTEIVAGDGAVVDHYKVQREDERAYHVALIHSHLGRSSSVTTMNVSLGAALARNDVNAFLAGEGGEATLNGLYIAKGRQHVDNHTRIDHAQPHCPSHELYKGILDDHARAVFSGRIYVHPDAQKTDAKQTNQNLLLSRDALVDTKPQLEIFADDVRCTHGATIGQLDDEAMFYLQTRGIPEAEARGLLIYAFASDILGRIKLGGLRENLDQALMSLRGRYDGPSKVTL